MRVTERELSDARRKITAAGKTWERDQPNSIGRPTVARILGVTGMRAETILGYLRGEAALPAQEAVTVSETESLIRDFVSKSKGKATIRSISEALDRSESTVLSAVDSLRERGFNLKIRWDGTCDLSPDVEPGAEHIHQINTAFDEWVRFGATGDNHLGNRHQRLDVLSAVYDIFAGEGVTAVYNTGNWIDGEARFNKNEFTTYYVAGDDHEGWYQQRECIEIGRYLEMRARQAGRTDLVYLGYQEANVQLEMPNGFTRTLRVSHPGGGSAYAISYKGQKNVEAMQGGEKPHVLLQGHYHKYNVGYPREVYVVDTATTCDQTGFMRKKGIQAMVGGVICEIRGNEEGTLWRYRHEFFPFYDRNLYERAWSAKGAA